MLSVLHRRTLATLTKPTLLSKGNSKIPASLRFASGEEFKATSFGCASTPITSGEVVFTTSVVGYPESMTDPSYHGQILVFTQPIIGNYGVPPPVTDKFGLYKYFESSKIQVSGIVVNDYAAKYSHWNAVESLGEWCKRSGIPAITGVDTRALVTLLREHGSKPGHLSIGQEAMDQPIPHYVSDSSHWIENVSPKQIRVFNQGASLKIALVDCGAKQNIIRCLAERGAEVTVFPHDFDFSASLEKFDGVFLSNGPGDPLAATATVKTVRKIVEKSSAMANPIPIFGICMGHQVLGLAAGFSSYKLPFGNRGHNQPALDLINGGCVITSQNHGYALDDTNPPAGWKTYFRNANDGSNEGIKHESLPFASVQFHPEAMGGPLDTQVLFDGFMADVQSSKIKRHPANLATAFSTLQVIRLSSHFMSQKALNEDTFDSHSLGLNDTKTQVTEIHVATLSPVTQISHSLDLQDSKKRLHDDVENTVAQTLHSSKRRHALDSPSEAIPPPPPPAAPAFDRPAHPPAPPPAPIQYSAPPSSNIGPVLPSLDPADDPNRIVKMRGLVSTKDAGIVIGAKGAHVTELKDQMGVHIRVSPHIQGAPDRIMTLSGPLNAFGHAVAFLVRKLIEREGQRDGRRAGTATFRILVPAIRMGYLIGKGGSKIKELQNSSGAQIYSQDQNLPNSTERIMTLVGDPESLQIACYTIASLIGSDHENPTFPPQTLFDPGFRQIIPTHPYYPAGAPGVPGVAQYAGAYPNDRRGRPQDRYPPNAREAPLSGSASPSSLYQSSPQLYPAPGASPQGMAYPAQPGAAPGSQPALSAAEQQAAYAAYYQAYYPQMMAQMAQYSQMNPQMVQQYYASAYAQMQGAAGVPPVVSMGPQVVEQIRIPNALVGSIIGKGGASINQIRAESGSEIKIGDFVEGEADRKAEVHGTAELRTHHVIQARHSSFLSELQNSIKRQWEENKELQKDVKLISAEQEKVKESETMKNAKQALSATGQATSKVFHAVGTAVDATLQTPVVKATGRVISKTAGAVADVSAKVAEPILDTKAAKMVGSGIHQIKKDVMGTRNAYFAEYRPKEERDREKQELLAEKQKNIKLDEFGLPQGSSQIKPDDEATGMVMHRSSRLAAAWEDFKTKSPLGQTLHSYKRSVEESNNPLLRAWRNLKEKTTVNETETARVVRAFKQVQHDFDQHVFLKEAANFMIADILDAYLKGDKAVLAQWGTEAAFARLTADLDVQKQAGFISDCKLIDYRNVELSKLTLLNDEVPVAVLSFQTTEILCFRNKKGDIVLGAEDNIQNAHYSIALTKQQILDPEAEFNPLTDGWVIIEFARAAR
ncbi:Multifunctional pyrimidine synthesis protein CAD [Kappamyces sp. JEL0680]|nr:Multifunctional pyrimidine synthesis protein CAD [Kappamyces sp. JEL0680]